MTSRTLRCVCFVSVLTIGWTGGLARAQESGGPEDNLLDLSPEDLMEVNTLNVTVLATHTHLAGEWMIGYHPMVMNMTGIRAGTRRVAESEVLQNFMVTPTSMRMNMQMLHLMYAPTDDVTLMVVAQHLRLSMDHLTRMGSRFTTEAAGLGDSRAEVFYNAYGDVREPGTSDCVGGGRQPPYRIDRGAGRHPGG